jgi:hypothetical protein
MFGRRRKKDQEAQMNELLRVQRLQGDAHSAIMNQVAALHAKLDDINQRISFYNRPRP